MERQERSPVAQELLDAAIGYVAANGLTDLSLRRLATELGTSHRMLSHHFGSKEGLWVAIIHEVEQRQLALVDQMVLDRSLSPADAMRAWWQHISHPSLWPNERLFFEVYGQALHRRAGTAALLDGIVEWWLAPISAAGKAQGLSPADARASARLALAVTRGLLLDLLATEDRAGVDAAMERWIALNTRSQGQMARKGSRPSVRPG
ncbi:MAG: TetR/AcrR family transcriptional regulator [Actinomycetota bacterium]|nr:TetR/AcrR family transcriptional regulator [Actinomycetota bacterium]